MFIYLSFFFPLLIGSCCNFHSQSSNNMEIEIISIDSIFQINLYKINNNVVIAEYCTFEQVIKVGVLDTTAVPKYLLYNPYVGNDLFIYNCASCHYAPPSFSESIKGSITIDKKQLKSVLCGPKHTLLDSVSCKSLNDFEIFLLSEYLNIKKE